MMMIIMIMRRLFDLSFFFYSKLVFLSRMSKIRRKGN